MCYGSRLSTKYYYFSNYETYKPCHLFHYIIVIIVNYIIHIDSLLLKSYKYMYNGGIRTMYNTLVITGSSLKLHTLTLATIQKLFVDFVMSVH